MKTLVLIASILLTSSLLSGQSQHSLHIQHPPTEFDNIHIETLAEDSLSSAFIIWVKKIVALHLHQYHSEHVIILEGEAQMRVGDDTLQIKPGDHLFLPKGTPHAVWVTSSSPLKAISIQSPRFEGKDRVLLE